MDAIEINVGGCIFTTSLNTLTKHKDSIFTKMVNGTYPFGRDKNSKKKKYFLFNFKILIYYNLFKLFKSLLLNFSIFLDLLFIDRSPELFSFVLQYLRADQLDDHKLMVDQKISLYKALLTEAKFFNLNAFIFYLESKIRN